MSVDWQDDDWQNKIYKWFMNVIQWPLSICFINSLVCSIVVGIVPANVRAGLRCSALTKNSARHQGSEGEGME